MGSISHAHSQIELFPDIQAEKKPPSKNYTPLLKDLTLTLENSIVLGIIFIMVVILAFSFGIERGKGRQVAAPLSEERLVDNSDQKSEEVLPVSTIKVDAEGFHEVVEVAIAMEAVTEVEEGPTTVHETVLLPEMFEDQYTIQVASFKLVENAEKEAKQLRKRGYEIFVLPKGTHSIVCVGKFVEKKEAQRFASKLKVRYKDFLIRRL